MQDDHECEAKDRRSMTTSFLVLLALGGGMILPVVAAPSSAADQGEKVQVFILAGQSNMEGQGVVSMDHCAPNRLCPNTLTIW